MGEPRTITVPAALARAALLGNRAALIGVRQIVAGSLSPEIRIRQPLSEIIAPAPGLRTPTSRTKAGRRARRKLAAQFMGHR